MSRDAGNPSGIAAAEDVGTSARLFFELPPNLVSVPVFVTLDDYVR